MGNDSFQITDESGDRKYFTIVPNYIVNHSTAYEQAIYLYMKRVAGETGTCWESPANIGRKLKLDQKTIRKYQRELVRRGWIKEVGARGKTKPTIEYKIIDLWQINNQYYKEKGNNTFSQRKRNESQMKEEMTPFERVRDGNKEDVNKKIDKEDSASPSASTNSPQIKKGNADPVSLEDAVKYFKGSSQRHIQIIGDYAKAKRPDCRTGGQWHAFMKRNLRVATDLAEFSDEQIERAAKKIWGEEWLKHWTLETLLKYLINNH